MLIAFRVDASLQISSGHVMRCITLAKALRVRGCDCRFISREHAGHMLEFIRQQGFEAIVLLPNSKVKAGMHRELNQPVLAHAEWLGTDWNTDAWQTIDALSGEMVDWLIVDHYALDIGWETLLRPHAKRIMVIDDLADRDHNCDLLLDQNLVADLEHRYDARVPSECVRLLGPNYGLLQPVYADLHPRTPPRQEPVRRILVFFGGADQHNITGLALSAFVALQRNDIVLDIVIHPQSQYAEMIRLQAQLHENIIVHDILPSLASLMMKADLAIGAGGATSWERCCLGLPTLVVTLADNQKPIAEELDRQGFVRWLGHYDQVTNQMLMQALLLAINESGLEEWSKACMGLLDAKGAERVASIMLFNTKSILKARLARPDDEVLILRCSSAYLAPEIAYKPKITDKVTDQQWFYNRLRDPTCCRYYVVETEDGVSIGWVCFERNKNKWDIHYAVALEIECDSLGKRVLRAAMLELRNTESGALIFGCVESKTKVPKTVSSELDITSQYEGQGLLIAICSDSKSWMNKSIPKLLLQWIEVGHMCCWSYDAEHLTGGDLCFYLSYGRIVSREIRSKYRNNLVVHASDLPKGRGWSPTTWMILDGADRIPVTLLEAADNVDAGVIYDQKWFDLSRTDLADDWRRKLSNMTSELVMNFVENYPGITTEGREQFGEATYLPRRKPGDSRLDIHKNIYQQFDLFRIADNEQYPVFFEIDGCEFVLRISKRDLTHH